MSYTVVWVKRRWSWKTSRLGCCVVSRKGVLPFEMCAPLLPSRYMPLIAKINTPHWYRQTEYCTNDRTLLQKEASPQSRVSPQSCCHLIISTKAQHMHLCYSNVCPFKIMTTDMKIKINFEPVLHWWNHEYINEWQFLVVLCEVLTKCHKATLLSNNSGTT